MINKEHIEKRLKRATENIINGYLNNIATEEPAHNFIINQISRTLHGIVDNFDKEHSKALYNKKDRYPKVWMLQNKKIRENAEHLKPLFIYLNYVYKTAQSFKTPEDQQSLLIDGQNKIEATFITDQEFWQTAANKTGLSIPYMKKTHYLAVRCGFIKTKKKGNYWICSDGYFIISEYGRGQKYPYLKNEKTTRQLLGIFDVRNPEKVDAVLANTEPKPK